jgi:hypothetical protein
MRFFDEGGSRKICLHRGSLIHVVIGIFDDLRLWWQVRWRRIWCRTRRVALTGEPRGRTERLGSSLYGELPLGRFLVAFTHTFVALTLCEINHPVTALSRFGDRPLHFKEAFSEGQIVPNGVLWDTIPVTEMNWELD